MNNRQIDVEFLEPKYFVLYMTLFCHMDIQSKVFLAEDLQREWALKVIVPPLPQDMLLLFDGDRPCTEVDKPVDFSFMLSLPIWLHTCCVLSIFSVKTKNI